jgi:lysyl-tRNA synthetase class 2
MTSTPSNPASQWPPSAALSTLRLRAASLRTARDFFAERGVLEVDTPILGHRTVTDVHIHSARVELPAHPAPLYLQTSPEYAMKRLLASGSGDIYQIAHVFRAEERGRLHNAEFTLIEWYRVGFGLQQLMDEVAALAQRLLGMEGAAPVHSLSYAQAFERHLGCDPLCAGDAQLRVLASESGLPPDVADRCQRDELLDWLMGSAIGPRLGAEGLCFVHRYPASQAALARLDETDPRVALRFELYCRGVELANGFEELADAAEQRARFEADLRERQRRGLVLPQIDEALLAALAAGLPPVAGVALGLDRLLMLRIGASDIGEVLPFALERC